MTDRVILVIRHTKRLPQSRSSPFTNNGTAADVTKEKEEQKEEAVRLGVELSLFMAQAIFILSDDRSSMTHFCFWTLFKTKMDRRGPVIRRLYRVIQHDIKPMNRVYIEGGKSSQSQLMGKFRQDFVSAIRGLADIVSTLKIGGCLVKPSVFEKYNQELKKLEENLRSVKDVSEANGFSREAIESDIRHLWKSLFGTTRESSEAMKLDKSISSELIRPFLNEVNKKIFASSLASLVINKPCK